MQYNKGSDTDHRAYNDPAGGTDSDIGVQFRTDYYQKKALIEMRKEQYFGQLADVVSMPKHMGKTIKRYHYLPLLDDGNVNDQGIDAAGLVGDGAAVGTVVFTIGITSAPGLGQATSPDPIGQVFYAVGEDVTAAGAQTAAEADAAAILFEHGFGDGSTYATAKTAAEAAGWWVDDAGTAVPYGGNLYGSSKDIGTISGKMPTLTEHGGRVNRVGFKRIEIQGSIEKFGFFDEYTQESMDFDTDAELMMHINREMLNGANEITEDALQIDLINSAGVVRYTGDATTRAEVGDGAAGADLVTYDDLMRLSIDLDNNRCPKHTKLISGSRMIDTRTVYAARYMYCGSELIPTLKAMVDSHGNPAFIPVHQYAAATDVKTGAQGAATGEIGSIDQFRIIIVPEMMHWSGGGAAPGDATYRETGGATDVFPMLVVGSESFTTIGFQTNGKTVKFNITHKKPGRETADRNDPYGETGFMSIKWYYGFMALRPERLALIQTAAVM